MIGSETSGPAILRFINIRDQEYLNFVFQWNLLQFNELNGHKIFVGSSINKDQREVLWARTNNLSTYWFFAIHPEIKKIPSRSNILYLFLRFSKFVSNGISVWKKFKRNSFTSRHWASVHCQWKKNSQILFMNYGDYIQVILSVKFLRKKFMMCLQTGGRGDKNLREYIFIYHQKK